MFENWLKPKDAPTSALEQQLERAEEAHRAALAGMEKALVEFDAAGDDASAKALARARDAEQLAGDHVARAQRLLDAARQREAAEKREQLLARKAELEEQLAPAALKSRREPLVIAEVKALLEAAAVFAKRCELECSLHLELRQELARVESALGEPPSPSYLASGGYSPSTHDAARVLQGELTKLQSDDPRRGYMRNLITMLAPNLAPGYLL